MGLLENGLKGNIMTGLAVSIGTLVLGPTAVSLAARVVRPVAKTAIKGGLKLYGAAANVAGGAASVVKEARDEMQAGHESATAESESGCAENVDHEEIVHKARALAEQRGRVPGHELEDWLAAEEQVKREACREEKEP
jgi:hypothetical protein